MVLSKTFEQGWREGRGYAKSSGFLTKLQGASFQKIIFYGFTGNRRTPKTGTPKSGTATSSDQLSDSLLLSLTIRKKGGGVALSFVGVKPQKICPRSLLPQQK